MTRIPKSLKDKVERQGVRSLFPPTLVHGNFLIYEETVGLLVLKLIVTLSLESNIELRKFGLKILFVKPWKAEKRLGNPANSLMLFLIGFVINGKNIKLS